MICIKEWGVRKSDAGKNVSLPLFISCTHKLFFPTNDFRPFRLFRYICPSIFQSMADVKPDVKKAKAAKSSLNTVPFFNRDNYRWMLIGLVLVALGLFLMSGGKSKDPNVFNPNEVYSFTRITLAPILILAGFGIEIFAIFKKSKRNDAQ
jgi:hypothetical protein